MKYKKDIKTATIQLFVGSTGHKNLIIKSNNETIFMIINDEEFKEIQQKLNIKIQYSMYIKHATE